MLRLSRVLVVCALLASIPSSLGQDICSCVPKEIVFTFNLTGVCEDLNVDGLGVSRTPSCSISPFNSGSVSSLVPSTLNTINIIESGQNFEFLTQVSADINAGNGASFRFESSTQSPIGNPNDRPRQLEVTIVGRNIFNEELLMAWIINYNTGCNAFPFFSSPGQRIGWTTLTTLEDPLFENCPAVGSRAPSLATIPTRSPTGAQSASTKSPVAAGRSTKAPTRVPTKSPSRPSPAPSRCSDSSSKGGKGGKGKKSSSSSKGKSGKRATYYDPEFDCAVDTGKSGKGKRGKGSGSSSSSSGKKSGKGKGSSSSDPIRPTTPIPPTPSLPTPSPQLQPTPQPQPPSQPSASASGDSAFQDMFQPVDPVQSDEREGPITTQQVPPPYIPQTSNELTENPNDTDNRTGAIIGVFAGITICLFVFGVVIVKQRQQNNALASRYKAARPTEVEPATVAETGAHSYDDTSESYYQGSLSPNN